MTQVISDEPQNGRIAYLGKVGIHNNNISPSGTPSVQSYPVLWIEIRIYDHPTRHLDNKLDIIAANHCDWPEHI
jgi:hypothetical protein